MNRIFLFLLLFVVPISISAQQKEFPKLTGPYLGQKPLGMTPEIFAPGIISTDLRELNSVFTPDGKEFYFTIQTPGKGYRIYFTEETNNGWTKPAPVSFSSNYSDVDMCITPDGQRMYFGSTRSINGDAKSNFKIWYVERINDGWSDAKYLNAPVNNGQRALYPSITKNGTMFFQAVRDDSYGEMDIYYSELIDNSYQNPVHLGKEINTKYAEGDILISPDENYMIVNSKGRADDMGGGDLYISFKNKNGSWGELTNMGEPINSTETDYCPMLSPDGKYFFFTSRRSGNGDIYWVDAKIIEELRKN